MRTHRRIPREPRRRDDRRRRDRCSPLARSGRTTRGPAPRRRRRTRKRRAGSRRSRARPSRAAHGGKCSTIRNSTRCVGQVEVTNQTLKAAEARVREARALTQQARAALFPDRDRQRQRDAQRRPRRHGTNAGDGGSRSSGVTQQLQRRARRQLGDRPVGPRAPHRRGRRSDRAGERRRPRSGQAVRAGAARAGLFPAARAGRRRSPAAATPSPPTSSRCSSRSNQYAAGVAARADVAQAETQLKSTQAQALDAGVQRAQLEHAIAVLIGKAPADFSIAPEAVATDVSADSARRCRPSCSSAGRTSPRPSAARRRPMRRSASPRPRSFRR